MDEVDPVIRTAERGQGLALGGGEVLQGGPAPGLGHARLATSFAAAAPAPAHNSIAILTTPAARTVHSPGKKNFLNFLTAGLNHSLWACRNSYIWPDGHRISTFPAA